MLATCGTGPVSAAYPAPDVEPLLYALTVVGAACAGSGLERLMPNRSPGRPRSIPPEHFGTVLTWYREGMGYMAISRDLRALGVDTTPSSVRRLVKGQGSYASHGFS